MQRYKTLQQDDVADVIQFHHTLSSIDPGLVFFPQILNCWGFSICGSKTAEISSSFLEEARQCPNGATATVAMPSSEI